MKRSSWILGAAFLAGFATVASKRKQPPAPEGSWKDASIKPSTNGKHPA
ncbi:MAG TPA: hypothetical protein VFV09_06075 [Actinomycetota bacterium]|jgi:hypothetical protein|nr:hypothetical protein [Actinomycetota bacterium]